jgi:hypothetical protein
MRAGVCVGLCVGVIVGAAACWLALGPGKPAFAGNGDRFEDYVLCTGAVGGKGLVDGVWLLDYRSGKLLGTVIDKNSGKVTGWHELDLVKEFGIPPRQNVHFLTTTGNLGPGQSALYVAETTTGKFGVYSMSPTADGAGVQILRHDMVPFRK